MIIPHSVLLIMRNVLDKSCRENKSAHFVFNNFFFYKNLAFYDITWKNMVQPERAQF